MEEKKVIPFDEQDKIKRYANLEVEKQELLKKKKKF